MLATGCGQGQVQKIVAFAVMLVSLLLFLTAPRLGHWYLLAITLTAGVGLTW
ncbi:MAG: hypothetical protein JO287_26840 [Pseudonocardiales bacterium]|nr:hypothetical protein [Pseudonocardiales bacterium]